VYEAIMYFRHMVEIFPYVIFTDHKPLTLSSNAEINVCHKIQSLGVYW